MGYSRASSQSLVRTFKYTDIAGFGRRRFDLFAIKQFA
jgi:hypothetical protein